MEEAQLRRLGFGGGEAAEVTAALTDDRRCRRDLGRLAARISGWVAACRAASQLIAETSLTQFRSGGGELRERGLPVVPHGIGLSLGGVDPVEPARVTHLAACAAALDAPLASEHVAFVRAGGREAGHLLPVPRTREALDVLVANIRRTQAELDVPLALEPIATLFDWPENEFTEPDFLTELIERTDTLLLLDVANLYANARNRGQDPRAQLDRYPLGRFGYVHVAGGSEQDGRYTTRHLPGRRGVGCS